MEESKITCFDLAKHFGNYYMINQETTWTWTCAVIKNKKLFLADE